MRSMDALIVFSLWGAVAIAADVPAQQQDPASAASGATPTNVAPAPANSSPLAATATPPSSVPAAAQPSQTANASAAPVAPSREGASSNQAKAQTASAPSPFKPPQGYRVVKHGSTTVYCKTINPIGSHIPQTTCLDEQQVREVEGDSELVRQAIEQRSSICVGGGVCKVN